jgi:hypothetical protein
MQKTIYQLLNEVETDFTEYEQVELSSEEKDYYKQKILMEVKDMKDNTKNNGNKKIWKKAVGIAAACAVVVGAAGTAANPVLAKQIFSRVFGNLIDISEKEESWVGQNKVYTKIAENALPAQGETDKYQDSKDYVTTVEDNGVTVSVSDVYCDGYSLYYTLAMTTDNEDLNKADTILLYKQNGDFSLPKVESEDGKRLDTGCTWGSLKKSEDGSFVGMLEISFSNDNFYAKEQQEKLKSEIEQKGRLVVDCPVEVLTGVLNQEAEDQCLVETACVEGKWNLKFPVTVDNADNQTFEINQEDNGILVESATKTKTGLILTIDYSTYATRPPYDFESGDIWFTVKDTEGNNLENLDWDYNDLFTENFEVLYDGQKDIIVEAFTNTQENRGEMKVKIAEIPIHLP